MKSACSSISLHGTARIQGHASCVASNEPGKAGPQSGKLDARIAHLTVARMTRAECILEFQQYRRIKTCLQKLPTERETQIEQPQAAQSKAHQFPDACDLKVTPDEQFLGTRRIALLEQDAGIKPTTAPPDKIEATNPEHGKRAWRIACLATLKRKTYSALHRAEIYGTCRCTSVGVRLGKSLQKQQCQAKLAALDATICAENTRIQNFCKATGLTIPRYIRWCKRIPHCARQIAIANCENSD